jgi:23S rRNA (adenine1618-N6)-methyltransferase
MYSIKKELTTKKLKLHVRNKHRERYDFDKLIGACSELAKYVKPNKFGDLSIDFFNPDAVKALNKAILKCFYEIDWDIPPMYLCPPIPGRADYIHYVADLLSEGNLGTVPVGKDVRCLDIGCGANCVYPIIGNHEYGWSFVGSDIDKTSISSANKIVELNLSLKGKVEVRYQDNTSDIFSGIIKKDEFFDLTICNPPFHKSLFDAQTGTLRKLNNLTNKKTTKPLLNFGGQSNELWCKGGELQFITNMIKQSKAFANSCFWFSTLVSNKSNLRLIYVELQQIGIFEMKTIEMGQGNKTSRIVAWTFLDKEQQRKWQNVRWYK